MSSDSAICEPLTVSCEVAAKMLGIPCLSGSPGRTVTRCNPHRHPFRGEPQAALGLYQRRRQHRDEGGEVE